MAVLARNRSTSTLEFYHTAMKLRKSLYFLMMRDFGTKDKVRNVSDFTKGMDKDDADAVTLVFERYHIRKINMYWPEWVIERIRDTTCKLIDDLVINIERARSIWPKMKAEYEERRVCQDRAIGCLESLLAELTLAVDVLPVDADKFRAQVELIEKERALIKGWRKSDNKRFKHLLDA